MTFSSTVVYSASGQLEAEMIRIFLESAGIPAQIIRESAGAAIGLTVGPLGQVEVIVDADRKEEATALLEKMERGDFIERSDKLDEDDGTTGELDQ